MRDQRRRATYDPSRHSRIAVFQERGPEAYIQRKFGSVSVHLRSRRSLRNYLCLRRVSFVLVFQLTPNATKIIGLPKVATIVLDYIYRVKKNKAQIARNRPFVDTQSLRSVQ